MAQNESKFKTVHCLTLISIVDLIWGSGGMITLIMWLGYAIIKY